MVPTQRSPALVIAAPSSGSGKTTVTLALLRALTRQGLKMGSFKIGPDYIDPAFHHMATGNPCHNVDGWAMRDTTITSIVTEISDGVDLVIGEGVMGLFDGAQGGGGSTADIAADYKIPVILVIDSKGQAMSVAALLQGFDRFRNNTRIAGVIFNKVGGPNHVRLLKEAAEVAGIVPLGFIPKSDNLLLDHRHLGLVQAREADNLDIFLNKAADIIEKSVDLEACQKIALAPIVDEPGYNDAILPFGQNITIAHDDAFAFLYPHLLSNWRRSGVEISFFSPLADQSPDPTANAIFLPGGYPELHCEKLSLATNFKSGMERFVASNKPVYGECGGFMVLGEVLTDANGTAHEMLGMLPVSTSFSAPKRHLGYRQATLIQDCVLGLSGTQFRGHEFHYAELTTHQASNPLFDISNARGDVIGLVGAVAGNVAGSFIHLIDKA